MATNEQIINETIARAKTEILADVASGKVPATVETFAELHDHVDANGYGGFFEEDSPFGVTDDDLDPNLIQNALDEWIRGGGLKARTVEDTECETCGADITFENGRWFHTRVEDGSHEATPEPEECWICDRNIYEGDEPGHGFMDNGEPVPLCSVACTTTFYADED